MSFTKPAKTYQEQIAILQSRGLLIADEPFATNCLKHYNYYRLSAYWRPFLEAAEPAKFKDGARFEDVWKLYCFDRELRQLVNEATKRVEISARARWAFELGHACGALSYEDPANFTDRVRHAESLAKFDEQIARSQEDFIAHFKSKYGMTRPPIWAACEVMSFGVLSRMFALLKDQRIKKHIAATYSLPEPVFESLLHHLTYVRNLCAHHSRLWNRRFTITPSLPVSFPANLVQSVNRRSPEDRKIYNSLVLLAHACGVIDQSSEWRARLLALLGRYPAWCGRMGFPAGWDKLPIWTASYRMTPQREFPHNRKH